MLINRNNSETNPVKFVSYTGRYPNLCSGILTLEIDGEFATFGHNYWREDQPQYRQFWSSGGGLQPNYEGTWQGEWQIDVNKLPEQFRQYATEIDEVFNNNVKYGCCGGCI